MRYLPFFVLGLLCYPHSVGAQDMNTIGRHLEMQQWQRLQDHQNRNRTASPRHRTERPQSQRARCSANSIPAAERQAVQAQAERIQRRDGREAAVQWVANQARAHRDRLIASGACH